MKVCAIDGCDKRVQARGLCSKHYTRWRKYGDPTVNKNPPHVAQHGTMNEYGNYGCRCDECRTAASEYQRERCAGPCKGGCGRTVWAKHRSGFCSWCSKDDVRKPLVHGTSNGYLKKGCRCAECRAWSARVRREYRRTHPEQAERERERERIRKKKARATLSANPGKVP